MHLAADRRCHPLALVLSHGQRHDVVCFATVMAHLRVPRTGLPRTRPVPVIADRAYSSRLIRTHLRRRGIKAVIPEAAVRITNRKNRGRARGGPPTFTLDDYKISNTVERCTNRIKQWRGLAIRTDRLAIHYHAALVIWARKDLQDTP